MFKSTQEFESAMRDFLIKFRDGEPLDSFTSNVDSADVIIECIDRGLLKGVSYSLSSDDSPCFSWPNPRISYAGLRFIESH